MGSLVVSASAAGLLSLLVHQILFESAKQSVGVALGAMAVELSRGLEKAIPATVYVGVASPSDIEVVRAALHESRDRFLKEFPPALVGEPAKGYACAMLVVRDEETDRGIIRVSTLGGDEGAEYTFDAATPKELRWATMNFSESFVRDARGEFLSGSAPVRDDLGRPLGLIVLQARSSYFDVVRRPMVDFVLLIFAAALLVSYLLASAVAGWATRPLRHLGVAMDRVQDGDLTSELEHPGRGDEFDTIALQFNKMVRGLRERMEMARSLDLAKQVQAHLLPSPLPEVPGYELALSVIYCDETGGDYADLFPLDEERGIWSLLVGDVTGHGISAALLMSWTRAMLRAAAPASIDRPSELLQRANRQLVEDTSDSTFLTLYCGMLDTRTHTLRWSSGGHDPAIVWRAASNNLEFLHATDLPLGVMQDASFPEGALVRLEPGDVVLVATDGLSQARNISGEYFGFERIANGLRVCAGQDVEEIRRTIEKEVRSFIGAATFAEDDMTFLILRRRGGSQQDPVRS